MLQINLYQSLGANLASVERSVEGGWVSRISTHDSNLIVPRSCLCRLPSGSHPLHLEIDITSNLSVDHSNRSYFTFFQLPEGTSKHSTDIRGLPDTPSLPRPSPPIMKIWFPSTTPAAALRGCLWETTLKCISERICMYHRVPCSPLVGGWVVDLHASKSSKLVSASHGIKLSLAAHKGGRLSSLPHGRENPDLHYCLFIQLINYWAVHLLSNRVKNPELTTWPAIHKAILKDSHKASSKIDLPIEH